MRNPPDAPLEKSEVWPIKKFADTLDISRDTARRLFKRQVLPQEWVRASSGRNPRFPDPRAEEPIEMVSPLPEEKIADHPQNPGQTVWERGLPNGNAWLVEMTVDRLAEAKALLSRWKVYRRKPRAARAFPDPQAVSGIAFKGIERQMTRDSLTSKTFAAFQAKFLSRAGQREFGKVEKGVLAQGQSVEGQASLLLLDKMIDYGGVWGFDLKPTSAEIAEMLCCSVASLYRPPFGKDAIGAAWNLAQEFGDWASLQQINEFAERLGRDPTANDLVEEFGLSATEAETKLIEWFDSEALAEPDDPWQSSAWNPPNKKNARRSPSLDFALIDSGKQAEKKIRDRRRLAEERSLVVEWEVGSAPFFDLYLVAVPRLARETFRRYGTEGPSADDSRNQEEETETGNRKKRSVTDRQYYRAKLRIESGKEPIGCVLWEAPDFLSRFFLPDDQGHSDHRFHSASEAIRQLLDEFRKFLPRVSRPVFIDWKDLQENPPLHGPESCRTDSTG